MIKIVNRRQANNNEMIVNIKLVIIKRIKSCARRDPFTDEEKYPGSSALLKNFHILFVYYLIIF